jgi:hypothetical protein
MKLLLDENLPHGLGKLLGPHETFTVASFGWAGRRNGELLASAAQKGIDALISLDGGIEFEQNLATLPCSAMILRAPSNRIRDLRPLVPAIIAALETLAPRTLIHVPEANDK